MPILPDLENALLFLAVATILVISPGPAVLYIVAKSIEQGYKAGIISVLGIGLGGLVHVIGAGFGISAILVTSATAFLVLKYLGAVYLIYLGVKKMLEKPAIDQQPIHIKKRHTQIFYEGVLVNIFNPKTAIFFLAFLPQFVSLEKGGVTSQIVFLGLLFIVIAVISDSLYVLLSGKIAFWIRTNKTYIKVHKYVIGFIYITLGLITLGVSQPSNKRL
jgi:threonine/homoserine/homoserine lactone efflux protein